jgi:Lipid A 3-O-deacylase (PagL)
MSPKPPCLGVVLALAWASPAALCQQSSLKAPNWDLSLLTSIATGEENLNSFSEAQILKAGIFVGKTIHHELGRGWRRGSLEYAFSVAPLVLALTPERLYGVGLEPVIVRWNSLERLGPVVPYIELAGGALRTAANLPRGDTSKFNFTAKGGGGVYLRRSDREALEVGLSWSHISNANLGRRNPEFNGIELRLAYHWFH